MNKTLSVVMAGMVLGLTACGGGSSGGGGGGNFVPTTTTVQGQLAGDSSSFTGTSISANSNLTVTDLNYRAVSRFTDTLRIPVIAAFNSRDLVGLATVNSDGTFSLSYDVSATPDGSVLTLRFYDANAVTPANITFATPFVSSLDYPVSNLAGVVLNANVILTGGIAPGGERVVASVTRSDHPGATFTFDTDSDTNNDGVVDASDRTVRLSFADGLQMFDRDLDGFYGDDVVRINRSPTSGVADNNPLVNAAAFFDSNNDGRGDTRATVNPQDTVSALAIDTGASRIAADGQSRTEVIVRAFGSTTGSPFAATLSLSSTGAGTLSANNLTVPLLAGADGALRALTFFRADTTLNVDATVMASVDSSSVAATTTIRQVDPVGVGNLALSADRATIAFGGNDSANITASVAAVSSASTVRDTNVAFSTDIGVLGANNVMTTNGVATVSFNPGNVNTNSEATITASVTDDNGTLISRTLQINLRARTIVVAPASATLTSLTGMGSTVQLAVTEANGGANLTTASSTNYTSGDTGVVTVSTTGLVTATGVGATTVTITNQGATEIFNVTVTDTPDSIAFVNNMPAIDQIDNTFQLNVNGVYGMVTLDVTNADTGTTYSTNNPLIATVDKDGVVRGRGPGQAVITAFNGGQTADATVTVLGNEVNNITLVADGNIIAVGGQNNVTLTATPTTINGNPAPDGTVVTFTTDRGTLGQTSAIVQNGVATTTITTQMGAMDGQTATVTASAVTFNAVVTSGDVTLTFRDRFVTVNPTTITFTDFTQTQQVMVADGLNNMDLTNDPNTVYSSSDITVATVTTAGVVSPVNNGAAMITASNAGVSAMIPVTVDVTPVSIAVTPQNALVQNSTLQLTVTGDFSTSGTRNLTAGSTGTTYVSDDTAIATVSADGLVTAVAPGSVTITATNRNVSDSTTLDVLPDTTGAIAITLDKMIVATNGTDTATITATLTPVSTNGSIPDGTVVNFTSTNGTLSAASAMTTNGVATVTIASGSAVNNDTADIQATTDGFGTATLSSNTETVTFRDRFLAITPAPITFSAIGDTQQLTAVDSISAADVTSDPGTTYTSTDMSVATVSTGGLVTAVNNGTATINVDNNGITGMVMVTVSVDPDSLSVMPTQSAISMVGGTQQLTVMGDFGGNMLDVTLGSRGTGYVSSDTAIATVSADGLVTSVAPGTVMITISNGSTASAVMAEVQSVPDTTSAIAITLSKATVSTNGTDVATISATLTPLGSLGSIPDGTVVNFTTTNGALSATSATTTNGVATVDISSGTAMNMDTADVQATTAGIGAATLTSNTETVTFRDQFLMVTPSPITFSAIGDTQQLTAVDSISAADVTSDPGTTYTSTDMSVATVSTGGLVTAVNNGTATINVDNNGITGSVMVTVSVDPDSLSVMPTQSAISMVGGTQQLTVMGDFGGNMLDVTLGSRGTGYVSSDTAIATVSADGLVTSVAPGTVMITISNGSTASAVMAEVQSVPDTTGMVAIALSKASVSTNGTDTAMVTATLTPIGSLGMIPDGTVVNFTTTNGALSAASATTTNGVATVEISSGTATNLQTADIQATTAGIGTATLTSNTETVTFRDQFLMVTPAPISLTMIGATQQLTAVDSVSAADVTSDPGTTYTSTDMSVATVSTGGLVTAVNNGTATINVDNNGITGSVMVTVSADPDSLSVMPATASITMVNGTQQLAVMGDFGGTMLDITEASRGTTYMSSDTAIATVSADGLVTALTPGMVTITVNNGGTATAATAMIDSLPDTTASVAITLSKAVVSTNGTDVATISATLTPVSGNGTIPDGTVVNFTTTNGALSATSATTTNGVATVDISSGTAMNMDTADVQATTAGFGTATLTSNTETVTFRDAFLQFAPDPVSFSMIGDTQQLAVTESVGGMDVTSMTTFMSSDTSVATVDANGLVTAVNNGSAMISGDANGVTGTVMVTVAASPSALTIAPSPVTISTMNGTEQLTVTGDFVAQGMLDQTPASRGTTYMSADTNIATVSADGLVTAVGPGSTTVTATNNGTVAMVTINSDFATDYTVSPDPLMLNNGDTQQLSLVGNNAGMTDFASQATYTSADPSVASVTTFGLVTGRVGGSTTITIDVPNLPTKMLNVTVTTATTAFVTPNMTATAGQTGIVMPITLDIASGDVPTSTNFDIALPPGAQNATASLPTALQAAGFTLQQSMPNSSTVRVVIFSFNSPMPPFPNGPIVNVTFDIAAGTAPTVAPLVTGGSNQSLSNSMPAAVPFINIGGTFTIN